MDCILKELYPNNQLSLTIRNKLYKATSQNCVNHAFICDHKTRNKDQLVIKEIKTSETREKDADAQAEAMDSEEHHEISTSDSKCDEAIGNLICINVPNGGIKISKTGGKVGLCFITRDEWERIKDKGEWGTWPYKTIKRKLLLSSDTKEVIETGDFNFVDRQAKSIDYFNEKTPFEEWIEKHITESYLETLNDIHKYVYTSMEIGNKCFASLNSIKLASACDKIF